MNIACFNKAGCLYNKPLILTKPGILCNFKYTTFSKQFKLLSGIAPCKKNTNKTKKHLDMKNHSHISYAC